MDEERRFRSELLDAVSECRRIGYSPNRFVGMLNLRGSFEVARSLLGARDVSEGFTTLWEKGRLDLSVEAIVLKPQWREHFSTEEVETARRRLSEVNYHAPWDTGEAAADRDGTESTSGAAISGPVPGPRERSTSVPSAQLSLLPPVPDAEDLLVRVRAVAHLPERNHEDVVKDLLLRLGFDAASIVFQTGRVDICVMDQARTLAVVEVKRSIGGESERAAARRQGMDYAAKTSATFCIVTDGDRYEIYDRRRGLDYEAMLCGRFQLTAFAATDVASLDMLRPDKLRGGNA